LQSIRKNSNISHNSCKLVNVISKPHPKCVKCTISNAAIDADLLHVGEL